MKILIVTDAWRPQVNGVVRTYEYLSEELIRRGHVVQIIGPHDFPFRTPMPGYREIELALFPYRKLARMMTDFAPDSIHIATEGPLGKAAQKWCRRHQRRFSTAFHTMFPDYVAKRVAKHMKWLYQPARNLAIGAMRRFHNNAAVIITPTPTINDILQSWHITAPMAAIPRGVPVELFTVEGPVIAESLAKPVALYVGRVAIEKNIEDFLNMEWEGQKVVVGDGPALAEFQARYKNVKFAGRKVGPDLAQWYRSADVFVFPSKTDTFGIVLIEAISCGLPVAAYPVQGPRDIVTAPWLGALDTDLARAAKKALQAPGIKEERHDHAVQNYTWSAFADRFLDAVSLYRC